MDVIRKKIKPKKIKTQTETIDNPTIKVPEQQIVTARNFYNGGFSAELSSKQPSTPGRETCQKLWRFWDGQRRDEYEMDTNERQINQKQRMGESYSRMLFKLEIQLNKYETVLDSEYKDWQAETREMEQAGQEIAPFKLDSKTEMHKLAIVQAIIECREKMAGLVISSTIDERDELKILEHIKKKNDRYAEIDAQFREKEARDLARKQNIPRKLHQSKNIDELTELDSDSEPFDSKDTEL